MDKVFLESRSLDQALKLLGDRLDTAGFRRLAGERLPAVSSSGRVTAGAVFARYSSPAYHSCAMDGFAVRFSDTLQASDNRPLLLGIPELAVSVDTGDPLPKGFDSVIMLEDINIVGKAIEILSPSVPYQHVRTAGEDIIATEMILPENHLICPVDIGALIAAGHLEVDVVRRPTVGIIPTGTELVEPETVRNRPPAAPEIIDYNSAMLAALAEECGAAVIKYPIIADNLELIRKAIIDAALTCDMVIVNAGSGRGSEDFTAAAISGSGELIFNSVSIRPGKPVIAGIVNNRPVLGIPGYPVSAFMTFRLFAAPLIARLHGAFLKKDETLRAALSRQLASHAGIDEFVRVNVGMVGGRYIATPAGRGAGLLMSVVHADGMIRIPAGSDGIAAGTEVDVEIFRDKDELGNTVVCIGSHDNALDILANFIKKRHSCFAFSSSHVGSMGGIMALKKGEAHVAGIHLLDSDSGEYNVPFIRRYLRDKCIVLINFSYRLQGLLVRKGNPMKISGLADLTRKDIAFINRQAGSGTRLLLDKCLADLGIDGQDISGYSRDEYTHMAVASSVLTGLSDTGLAVYSAARALDLDFIPVAEERYDLAVPREFMGQEKVAILIDTVRNDAEFREYVNSLGGYDMRDAGTILYES